MTDCLASEVLFFLYSVLTGSFFAFIYDHFRLLRRLIRHARFVVHLEDLIFWIICFFVSFFLLYYGNNGVLRFCACLGAAIGMSLYFATLGRIFLPGMVKLCHCIFRCIMLTFVWLKNKLTHCEFPFTMKVYHTCDDCKKKEKGGRRCR